MARRDRPTPDPWELTGASLRAIAIDVSAEPYVDLERAAAAMIARE